MPAATRPMYPGGGTCTPCAWCPWPWPSSRARRKARTPTKKLKRKPRSGKRGMRKTNFIYTSGRTAGADLMGRAAGPSSLAGAPVLRTAGQELQGVDEHRAQGLEAVDDGAG